MTKWEIINSLMDITIGSSILIIEATKNHIITGSVVAPTTEPFSTTTINPWLNLQEVNSPTIEVTSSNYLLGSALLVKGVIPLINTVYDKFKNTPVTQHTDNTPITTICNTRYGSMLSMESISL